MKYIFDIETNGLLDELTCIHSLVMLNINTGEMISCPPNQHAFLMTIEEGIRELMNADLIVGHNIIKFDIPAIQKLFPWFQPKGIIRDTIVCSRLIYTNLKELDFTYRKKHPEYPAKLIGKHALEAWGNRLGEHKGEFNGPWTYWSEELQTYCEQDTRVTYQLWQKIQSKQYSEQAIQLEHDFARILFKQEQRGFAFDAEAGRKLYADLCKKRLDLEAQLQDVFPPWEERTPFTPKVNNAKRGYQKGVTVDKVKTIQFNPNSRDHIAQRLQAQRGWKPTEFTEDGKPKVDETVLEAFDWPEAKLLAEYLMIQKRIGQLAEGAQAWLKLEKQGRIYGQVITNGAVTGRCTHKYPNVTQVPAKGSPYGVECRSLFQPSQGFVLLGCDASSLELRCLAHYMAKFDDGAYVKVLLEDDIHVLNQKAAGLASRDQAKRFIYAFLYGAGNAKLGSIIGAGFKEGHLLKKRFLARTPALKYLKDEIAHRVEAKGYLKGLDGRLLHIRSDHSALNTLLQSAGALLVKQATVFLFESLTEQGLVWGSDWAQVAHVHDELQLEVKPELAEQIGQTAVRCFERAGEYFNFRCPITGEYRIGQSWAETH